MNDITHNPPLPGSVAKIDAKSMQRFFEKFTLIRRFRRQKLKDDLCLIFINKGCAPNRARLSPKLRTFTLTMLPKTAYTVYLGTMDKDKQQLQK